jgi:catechol 2,3-dioxygenase
LGGARHFDHSCIAVSDLQKAVDFYTKNLGLSVLNSGENVSYLGCGADEHFDLILKVGKPALEHSALRVDTAEEFARIQESLDKNSIEYKVLSENEPGVTRSVSFKIPSGAVWELVMTKESDYYRPTKMPTMRKNATMLLDVDHVGIYTSLVQKDCEFFRDILGMRISEVRVGRDGTWKMAFVRLGSNHHDIALFNSDEYHLSHYAWNLENMAGMVSAIDKLSQNKVELEIAPYRHYIGSNISCYFRGPDNLRIEYCTEMATMNDNTPTSFWEEGNPKHSAWGGITVQPSFWVGI